MSWFKFGDKAAGDPPSEQARVVEQAAQLRLNAVQQTQPIVEFGLDGRIFHANAAFCGLADFRRRRSARSRCHASWPEGG